MVKFKDYGDGKVIYDFDDYDDFKKHYHGYEAKPYIPNSLDAVIELQPHYSNPKFDGKGEVEIWGRKQSGIDYVYSDRLWQWDWNKAKEAAEHCSERKIRLNTARWVQEFLKYYYSKPIEVCHIYSGVNQSNGYSYWVAGFRSVVDVEAEEQQ
jgi:hypothetical protein